VGVSVGVINEDELIYLVRAFIIATEITVEDDDRCKTVGFREITAAVKIVRKIVLVFLYFFIFAISFDVN
jgi:hypothetical protein